MEFTYKNDPAKVNFKGQKANIEKKILPECTLRQLEAIEMMKDFCKTPVLAEEVACYLGIEGPDKVIKAQAVLKSLTDKGYAVKTQRDKSTAWILNERIFDC